MDGLVRCPRCWKHMPGGARFCPRCGSALTLWPVVGPRAVASKQPKPPGGGGITALLMFLVVGAFGLMVMLFVTSTTHAPVMVPPTPPAQTADPGASYDSDGGVRDRELRRREYEHRWETERQHHEWPPPPAYTSPNQRQERGSDSDR